VDDSRRWQYHARVPTLSIHPHLRRIAVAMVLAAYALPLALGAFSGMSHGVFHLLERLDESRARAAALGMLHASERTTERSTFTHSHGGTTHSHASPVDALLSASEHAGDEQDAPAATLVKLSAHTPASVGVSWSALAIGRAFAAIDAVLRDHPRPLPPLPPPRG
jgi:hypothetical protein